MKSERLKALAGAAVLTLALGACGSDDDSGPGPEESSPEEQVTQAATPDEPETDTPPADDDGAGEGTGAAGSGAEDVAVAFLTAVHAGDCAAAEGMAHGELEEFDDACTRLHEQFSEMSFDPTVEDVSENDEVTIVTIDIDGLTDDVPVTQVDGEWRVDLEYDF